MVLLFASLELFHLLPRQIKRVLERLKVFRRVVVDSGHDVRRLSLHVDAFQDGGVVGKWIKTGDMEEKVFFALDAADASFGEELE